MEEFKQLKWSWHRNYKEDLDQFPRRFDFNTISPHDILHRTINEIHKAVLPEETEYRLFRNPRIDSNDDENEQQPVRVKDPRRNSSHQKLSSSEMVGSYQNASSLTRIEQTTYFEDIRNLQELRQVEHNPELIKKCQQSRKKLRLLPNLIEKRKVEIENFLKSAEIVYYQQLNNYAQILDKDTTNYLVDAWNQNQSDQKYSIITRLVRNQKFDDEIQIDITNLDDDEIVASPMTKSTKFPQMNKLTIEDLKLFSSTSNKGELVKVQSSTTYPSEDFNVTMSAATLFKLLVDSESFQVKFSNISTGDGKTISKFTETFPLNPLEITESLQTFAHLSLRTSFHVEDFKSYLNENISHSNQQQSDYKLTSISDFFKKFYGKFKSSSKFPYRSSKRYQALMKFANQGIVVQYDSSDHFYLKDDTSNIPVNFSVKLEYQTPYGAEVMTREELLREWCSLKFYPGSELLRFRIDAASFNILSRETVFIEQIEKQLHEIYNTNVENLLMNVFNTILCINRLPPNEYLIIGKNQQILIYVESDMKGDALLSESWKISQNVSRKWTRIDENFITFLHLNHQLPPCSFYEPNIYFKQREVQKKITQTQKTSIKPPLKKSNYNLRLPKCEQKQPPQKKIGRKARKVKINKNKKQI